MGYFNEIRLGRYLRSPLYCKVEESRDGITLLNVSVIFTCFDVFKFPFSRITRPTSQARAGTSAINDVKRHADENGDNLIYFWLTVSSTQGIHLKDLNEAMDGLNYGVFVASEPKRHIDSWIIYKMENIPRESFSRVLMRYTSFSIQILKTVQVVKFSIGRLKLTLLATTIHLHLQIYLGLLLRALLSEQLALKEASLHESLSK